MTPPLAGSRVKEPLVYKTQEKKTVNVKTRFKHTVLGLERIDTRIT